MEIPSVNQKSMEDRLPWEKNLAALEESFVEDETDWLAKEEAKASKKDKLSSTNKSYSNSQETLSSLNDVVSVEEKGMLTRKFSERWPNKTSKEEMPLPELNLKEASFVNLDQDLSTMAKSDLPMALLSLLGITAKPGKIKMSKAILDSIVHYPTNSPLLVEALIEARKKIDEMISAKYQEKKESKYTLPFFGAVELEKKLKQTWIEQGFCRELANLVFHMGTREFVASYSSRVVFEDMFFITEHIFERESRATKILALIEYFTKQEKEEKINKGEHKKNIFFRENNLAVTLGIRYATYFLKADLKRFREIIEKHIKIFKNSGLNFDDLNTNFDKDGKRALPDREKKSKFQECISAYLVDFYSVFPSSDFQKLLKIRKELFKDDEGQLITFVGKNLIFEILSAYLRSLYPKESPEKRFVVETLKIITLFSIDGNYSDILNHVSAAFIDEPFYITYRSKHVDYIKKIVNSC